MYNALLFRVVVESHILLVEGASLEEGTDLFALSAVLGDVMPFSSHVFCRDILKTLLREVKARNITIYKFQKTDDVLTPTPPLMIFNRLVLIEIVHYA